MINKPFIISGLMVKPGERKCIELPGGLLYTQTPLSVPVYVLNAKKAGPRVFIIAAIHGDEINGIEIIRRLLLSKVIMHLQCGTLILIPVANVPGLIFHSRYLPDRRDLNRSFPGNKTGSLAARLAKLFMDEIITKCTHGIDFHTGNIHSEDLPHLRANTKVSNCWKIAKSFNVPLIVDTNVPDGSLRQAAADLNIPVLVYEGGEALRFSEVAIRIGLRGVLNVLASLHMVPPARKNKLKGIRPRIVYYNAWVRAPRSGIIYQLRSLGYNIAAGEKLGYISDPFSAHKTEIFSPHAGIIIGRNTLPLINEGDALFNIASFKGAEAVREQLTELHNYFTDDDPNDFL